MNPRLRITTFCFWFLLAIPGVWILIRFLDDQISYGQTLHLTGNWSVGLLAVALSITPLRKVLHRARWPLQLQKHRRAIGVASFGYAAFHTLVYVERKWGYGYILPEAMRPELATGWIALLIFLALTATSNDASVRILKTKWKMLHRWVHPATALIFAHWILTAAKPMTAWICAVALLATLAARFKSHSNSTRHPNP